MNDTHIALRRAQRLAAWSDQGQAQAAILVDTYRELLARRITNAQLMGLHNVVLAAPNFAQIRRFVTRQGEKADRAGRSDVHEYWGAVDKALAGLRGDAERLWADVHGRPADPKTERDALDALHCRLAREYVQHLVAHSMWARPLNRR